MNRVRLSSRFRLVLPRPVRQRLRLRPGMKFTVLDGQRVEAELPRMTPPPGAVPVELEV